MHGFHFFPFVCTIINLYFNLIFRILSEVPWYMLARACLYPSKTLSEQATNHHGFPAPSLVFLLAKTIPN